MLTKQGRIKRSGGTGGGGRGNAKLFGTKSVQISTNNYS